MAETALNYSNNDTYKDSYSADTHLKLDWASDNTDSQLSGEDCTIDQHSQGKNYQLTNRYSRAVIQNESTTIGHIIDDIKQEFSCVVTAIDTSEEEFSAQISDITSPENPDEEVWLSFNEIQDSDLEQLTVGDSFVWYIGYQQGPLVSRQSFSKIRFRRLPVWSQREIEVASSRAKELSDFFTKQSSTLP